MTDLAALREAARRGAVVGCLLLLGCVEPAPALVVLPYCNLRSGKCWLVDPGSEGKYRSCPDSGDGLKSEAWVEANCHAIPKKRVIP